MLKHILGAAVAAATISSTPSYADDWGLFFLWGTEPVGAVQVPNKTEWGTVQLAPTSVFLAARYPNLSTCDEISKEIEFDNGKARLDLCKRDVASSFDIDKLPHNTITERNMVNACTLTKDNLYPVAVCLRIE